MTITTAARPWDDQLAEYLHELSQTQDELLALLQNKRESMAKRDFEAMRTLQTSEEQLHERLQASHARREELLASAREQGIVGDSLGNLASQLPQGKRETLGKQVKDASWRMRLLQHQSLTNWVVAQRTLLHLSQMIEIIATGGRLQPTYGKSDTALGRGSLVDREA
jgi:hypothetical protein